jgi:hypothetical protein
VGAAPQDPTDELRRMVLLLETAEVLELRARKTRDVAQVPVLLRRAEHRRREAAEIRQALAARGAARPAQHPVPDDSPTSQQTFSRSTPPGQRAR